VSIQQTTTYLFPSIFLWIIGTTGTEGIFPVALADIICGWLDDTLDPSTSGCTVGRAGKEQVGLRKEIKMV
jgi:hypothetical protein